MPISIFIALLPKSGNDRIHKSRGPKLPKVSAQIFYSRIDADDPNGGIPINRKTITPGE